MSDRFRRDDGKPFEDSSEHVEGVEAGGGGCVDLSFYGEFAVQHDAEVAGGVCWCRSEFSRPPRVVPWGGVVPKDRNFSLVSVELQKVVLHPVSDTFHAFVEVGRCGGGVC